MNFFTKKASMWVIMATLSGATATAQNFSIVNVSEPITSVDDLSNGSYVVFEKNNAAGSYVYEVQNSNILKNTKSASGTPSEIGAIWKVVITDNPTDDGYKYSFQAISGNWMPQLPNSGGVTDDQHAFKTVTEDEKGYYAIVTASGTTEGAGVFNIKCKNTGGGTDVCFNGNTNNYFYGYTSAAGANSKHKIRKVTLGTSLTINETGYATAYYSFAVNVPENMEAYYVNAIDENKASLKAIDKVIPANTACILKANAGTYQLISTENSNNPLSDNKLSGTLEETAIPDGTNAYILGNGTNGIGFYQMDGTDRTLGANKAYLVLSSENNAVRSIIFSDGTTTGIESTVAEGAEAEEYYDLQGRRVMNPTKGIYVTKSGKKVLFNK